MNKKQKSLNNKGFSLVELIIVIAIMAVLVGALAPQYVKYLDKSKVSADTQVADSLRQAIQVTMLDPSITVNVPTSGSTGKLPASDDGTDDNNDFWEEVFEIIGVSGHDDLVGKLKLDSKATESDGTTARVVVEYNITSESNVEITIYGGNYGNKGDAANIVVK